MIRTVVVVVNKLKPFTHALPRLSWDYYQSSSKWLFCFLRDFFFELKRDVVARLHVGCIAPSVATCLMLIDESIAKQQGVLGVYLVRLQTIRKRGYDNRTPHDSKHLHGWRGRKHRAAHHPVDNPRELCARYLRRQRDMVRQDLYRMNRILMGKLVHTHGLGGEASHPWGTIV